jgi:hypothetical protein
MWSRYARLPPSLRTTSLELSLAPGQRAAAAAALAAGQTPGAAAADGQASAAVAAADALERELLQLEDMSNLTSMSSLDFDETPGVKEAADEAVKKAAADEAAAAAACAEKGGGEAGAAAAAGTAALLAARPAAPPSSVPAALLPATAAGGGGEAVLALRLAAGGELRALMAALLELLPSHAGDGLAGPAAAVAAASAGAAASSAAAASAAAAGPWVPARARSLQVKMGCGSHTTQQAYKTSCELHVESRAGHAGQGRSIPPTGLLWKCIAWPRVRFAAMAKGCIPPSRCATIRCWGGPARSARRCRARGPRALPRSAPRSWPGAPTSCAGPRTAGAWRAAGRAVAAAARAGSARRRRATAMGTGVPTVWRRVAGRWSGARRFGSRRRSCPRLSTSATTWRFRS